MTRPPPRRSAFGPFAPPRARAHPVDTPTRDQALRLPGATRTTAGAPVTLCIEVSTEPDATIVPGEVTLGWPIEVTRVGDRT